MFENRKSLEKISRRGGKRVQKDEKKPHPISTTTLISCYIASALIVVLSIVEARSPRVAGTDQVFLYGLLAVAGVLFSVYITWRNNKVKNESHK